MVVCKFFQQGNCRYGQNCKFEHIYGSKYSYHAPQPQPQQQQQPQSTVTDQQLLKQVQSDVQAAINGGQWLLSCYSPFKEKPVFPGITDLSPEEARLFIYEAKANNNVDEAVAYMNKLCQDARHKYEILLQPSAPVVKTLRSLYRDEVVASPFGSQTNGFAANTNPTSVFRSAVQNASVFDQTPSTIFGQNSYNNAFGQPQDQAKSLFAQASQNVFNNAPAPTNVYQSTQPIEAKSIFAQAAQATQNSFPTSPPPSNVFAAANINQNAFQRDPFVQQNTTPFGNSVFQISDKPTNNAFGGNVFEQKIVEDTSIYSNLEDLTEEDVEMFKSDSFKLGFIPEVPPPKTFC